MSERTDAAWAKANAIVDQIDATNKARWAEVAAVEREIRLCAYASAGDPKRQDDMKMFAIWAGRLQRAINGDGK